MSLKNVIKKIFTASLIFSFAVSGLNFQVSPAKAALSAAGPISPLNGYPVWFQDQNGVAIQLCLGENADGTGLPDPLCVLPGAGEEPNFDPSLPISFPDNFPGESFWWLAEIVEDGIGQSGAGRMKFRYALEAAFTGEDPTANEQILFLRVNLMPMADLVPGADYRVTHPFGQFTVHAGDALLPDGLPNPAAGVADEGKFFRIEDGAFAPPITPATAASILPATNTNIGPFLKMVNPAPPAGYLGDGLSLGTITPGPNGNFLEIDGPSIDVGNIDGDGNPNKLKLVDRWMVSGKIAIIDTVAPVIEDVSPTEIIVDSIGQAINTIISAHITDDLGARVTTIDLSSLGNDFSATLNGAQEVPTTVSTATGAGTFTIDTAANTLSFNINYSGLVGVGNIETAAHIHGPAAAGVNAVPIFDLPLGASKIGVWNYPENLEADILAGKTYVNIHSLLFPNGEIRGQILPVSNVQNMILTAGGTITNGIWGVIIPSITRMGTFSLPITTNDGSNTTNFDFQLSVVNPAPIANPDSARIGEGIGEQADIEVLLNDTDPNGNLPLSLVSAQNASAGTVVVAPDGQHVIVTAPTPEFAGVITAEYTVADSLGATSTGNISVNVVRDVTAPVITLLGANPDSVSFGAISYADPGATALDDFDGDVSASIITSGLPINTRGVSPQIITYTVADAVGNIATAIRTVNIVPDTVAPVITLNGSSPMNVELASVFTDPGATALDDVDGAVAVQATNNVNTAIVGAYAVNYTAADTSGNTAVLSRTVNVVPDATPPVITILGANPVTVLINSVYTDAGATALDTIDGNLTASIIASGLPLNTTATGTLSVTYNVADAAGNTATAVRIVNIVNDITPPVITITGANPASVTVGAAYTDAGATANDDIDGNITARIQTASTVNGAVAGTYTVIYTVSDTTGNSATSTRTVNVSAPAPAPSSPGGGGGGGGGLPPAQFQTTAISATPSPEVESQISRQLEIERQAGNQGQVLGEKIEFRRVQIKEIENEAEIINAKDLNRLLLNTYGSRQKTTEAEVKAKFTAKLKINLKGLSQDDESAITNFIAYGTANTKKLGQGERAGVLDSYKAAYGKLPTTKSDWQDVLKIAVGRFPGTANAVAEAKAKLEFKKIYLRDANLNNEKDKAAVNVMAYGLRPDNRNTNSEKAAILSFKAIFRKNPVSAIDWDKVRAMTYSGAKR